jgi:hypothetical protein
MPRVTLMVSKATGMSPPWTAPVSGSDIDVALQNQSLTLLALMAAHPLPHQALTRFRDLVDAWHQEPSEASLIRALQARAGRFAMNVDQVIQLLIPPRSAATGRLRSSAQASASARNVAGRTTGATRAEGAHDIWRAADSHQHMHDLFLMALLSTHTEPRRVSGQFRSLLSRLARSTAESALDPTSLVAVRRSAMRFDRIIQIVLAARDSPARRGGGCPARTPPLTSCRDGGSDTVDYGRASVGTDPHPPRR